MATRVIDDTKLQNIAVAIQGKDSGGTMTVDEMPSRINSLYSKNMVNGILSNTVEELIGIDAGSIYAKKMENCTSLKRIVFNAGTTKIEHDAFSKCSSIEYIIFPNTLQTIDSSAFGLSSHKYICKYIKFQTSASIGDYAFSGLVSGIELIDFRGVSTAPVLSNANALNGFGRTSTSRIVVDNDTVKYLFQSSTNLSVIL